MTTLTVTDKNILLPCNLCIDIEDEAKELQGENNELKTEYIKLINIPYSNNLLKLYNIYGLNLWVDGKLGKPFNKAIETRFKKMTDKRLLSTTEIRIPIANDILRCLSELKLCDIEGLGEITIDDNYVLSKFPVAGDPSKYEDGDDGIMIAPIDFGGFDTLGTFSFKDVRLLFSDLYLLQKAVAQCGSCFTSPPMQSCRERHAWSYWLKKNWWEYEGHGRLVNMEVELTTGFSPTTISFTVGFDNVISDLGGNFLVPTGYNNPFPECLDFCICLSFTVTNTKSNDVTYSFIDTDTYIFTFPANQTTTFNVCIDRELPSGFLTTFNNQSGGIGGLIFEPNFNMKVIGKFKGFYKGDIVQKKDLLSCEKTGLDILKANMNLFSGLLDPTYNDLFMAQPYDTIVNSEQVEGYFKGYENLKELDVECLSRSTDGIIEAKNNFILCYADSNDYYIDQQVENGNRTEEEGENGVLSYATELGANNDESNEKCNPCYEPTLNRTVSTLNDIEMFWLPVMMDSETGINNCINPRRLYIYNGQQEVDGVPVDLNYEGMNITEYPTAYQELPDNVRVLSNPDFDRQNMTMEEMYNIYYAEYLARTATQGKDRFCIALSYKEYQNLSFRERVKVTYKDTLGNVHPYVGILKKKQFNSCGKIKEIELTKENIGC